MKPFIIGIAGGTGSGKSTFTNRLKDYFGDRIALLCHDNYYRAQDHKSMEERKANNYDHPDALETELLVEHLKALSAGKDILCPVYDFTTHTRSAQTVLVKARSVILVEGILIFHDQALSNMFDLKIFVDADADERILRRVARDVKERGREVEDVMEQYLSTVKPMHYLYVEPTKAMADLVVNSGKNPAAYDLVKLKIESILEG